MRLLTPLWRQLPFRTTRWSLAAHCYRNTRCTMLRHRWPTLSVPSSRVSAEGGIISLPTLQCAVSRAVPVWVGQVEFISSPTVLERLSCARRSGRLIGKVFLPRAS